MKPSERRSELRCLVDRAAAQTTSYSTQERRIGPARRCSLGASLTTRRAVALSCGTSTTSGISASWDKQRMTPHRPGDETTHSSQISCPPLECPYSVSLYPRGKLPVLKGWACWKVLLAPRQLRAGSSRWRPQLPGDSCTPCDRMPNMAFLVC